MSFLIRTAFSEQPKASEKSQTLQSMRDKGADEQELLSRLESDCFRAATAATTEESGETELQKSKETGGYVLE